MRSFVSLLALMPLLLAAAPTAQADATLAQIRMDIASLESRITQNKTDPQLNLCLKQKLAPLQSLLGITLLTQQNLLIALNEGNAAHVELEERKLMVASVKAQLFFDEANACFSKAGLPQSVATLTGPNGTVAIRPSVITADEIGFAFSASPPGLNGGESGGGTDTSPRNGQVTPVGPSPF